MATRQQFVDLVRRVKACKRCPRMADSARVFGAGCGSLSAKVMFIGEAPGRLGADASELPFHGDKSGHNFESLLEQVGLSRYDAFVTNAVLCNPKDENGNNATPTPSEVANCASFLKEQLDLVDAPVVVTLGAVALRAAALVTAHTLTLKDSVRKVHLWAGRQLIPAYHPGQRAMVHRSFANQLADYQFIAEAVRRGSGGSARRKPSTKLSRASEKVGAAARVLLEESGELSYFALHKLLFMAEVRHLEASSERLTEGYYVRQKDGPYCVELHASRLTALIPGCFTRTVGRQLMVSLRQDVLFGVTSQADILPPAARRILSEVAGKYGHLPAGKLKTAIYLTAPMREVMRKEKTLRMNLFNSAVLPPP
ncbi:uracil-DNA glycosylase [Pigmentiphaga sp. NML030171]|nr:uracil-DNA glycosylase [Pigmentiphaga sp. NML030171]